MRLVFGIVAILLIASLVTNIVLLGKQANLPSTTHISDSDNSSDKFPLLAQRIQIEQPNDVVINFLPLRKQLKELVEKYGDSFAFYFEYLPTGVSISINEKENFIGASLIKLPVIMAFYHQKEREGLDFGNKTTKIQAEDIDKGFGDLWRKGEGYEISLEEAASLAIIDSDNTAANIVARNVLRQDFDDVYEGLDIDVNSEEGKTFINPRSYSSILKALYFSSVLDKADSQKVLELLSKSHFKDKLRNPLPTNVIVANKFGVFKNEGFQDCGIVYIPKRQYILCMMSKSDETVATERMVKVSDVIYKFVRDVNI